MSVPAVTGVVPNSTTSQQGGDVIAVYGSGFTDAIAVRFGLVAGSPRGSFTVVDDGELEVTTPYGIGTVDVIVTVPGDFDLDNVDSEATGADQFTYPREVAWTERHHCLLWTFEEQPLAEHTVSWGMPGVPMLIFGGLDLNDHVTYFLLPGFDPGERVKTWDEQRSYAGTVAQTNVREDENVQMTVPLEIRANGEEALAAAVDAINDRVEAGSQTLVYVPRGGDPASYTCVPGERATYPRLNAAVDGRAEILFSPWRLP